MVTKIYRGWITEGTDSSEPEYDDALGLEPYSKEERKVKERRDHWWRWPLMNNALVVEVGSNMYRHGNYLTVRYYISDQEASVEELLEQHMRTLFGDGDVDFSSRYSDITGYLWTDEELNVGGHNLLDELRSYVGKFCHLEIDYAEEPNNA